MDATDGMACPLCGAELDGERPGATRINVLGRHFARDCSRVQV